MKPAGKTVQQHMGATEGTLHFVMILCTLGLWYPVYKHRKEKLARTEKHYG